MAPISEIRAKNASFATQKQANDVCVFVGGTNGIGEGTLDVLSTLLIAPTIYVVGRSGSRWAGQYQHLHELNGEAKYVFVEVEVSTIRGVDRACKQIMAAESRIDYLCMSAGYFPLVGAIETPEGLEQCFTLSYWARIRFLHNLLPLLQQSPHPRVLSILAGGREGTLREDDMGLAKNWTIGNLVNQATTMMTLVFYRFATQDPNLTLIHAWPGAVNTDKGRRPKPDASASFLWRWTFASFQKLMRIMSPLYAISIEESGQRHAFLLTSDKLGPGVWRFDEFSETSPRSDKLEKYREEGKPDKVWDFTVATWNRALGVDSQKASS